MNNGVPMFISPADDTIRGRRLSLQDEHAVLTRQPPKGESNSNLLDDEVPLAIGMKAMVTFNVDTEADLTNGARGTIVEIVLDPVDKGAHTKQGITEGDRQFGGRSHTGGARTENVLHNLQRPLNIKAEERDSQEASASYHERIQLYGL
ncbi:hypothetical protein NLI96_g544 [Meripilus lineatus]|uniref:Uncharacterized protein n=1 Tax=Meripilus lineatus TaxID=2056292 RepID=A0AAD5VC40_9APHY|nr:hypothetical protein NLI96_g544 [Physisporinus lineatus]